MPDIYYIIVDGYDRADVLQELYQYDNQAFLHFLQARGFYIANESHSNYTLTPLSLASSLNMAYLSDLINIKGEHPRTIQPFAELIAHNRVRQLMQNQGYQFVAFATGHETTTIADADIFVDYDPGVFKLESMLLKTSATRAFEEEAFGLLLPLLNCQVQRGNILHIFNNLKQLPRLAGPQFVFAHIISPHPPFVFSATGEAVQHGECTTWDAQAFEGDREEYWTGYREQVAYVNLLLQETIDEILTNSETPPIIILQADHGSGLLVDLESSANSCLRERTSILNAYYLPGDEPAPLYPAITPVNSFRLVLTRYFGADLPLLADRTFFSTWGDPYQFEDITDKIEAQCLP